MDGDLERCRKLVSRGASVNESDTKGKTALHYATQEGHIEIVQFLIDEFADVNAKDYEDRTPIFGVAESQKEPLQIIELLLKAGADTLSVDKFDRTPLELAVVSNTIDVVSRLVQEESETLLSMAFQCKRQDDQGSEPVQRVLKLIDAGADVNVCDIDGKIFEIAGETPLGIAAAIGCFPVVKALIDGGANVQKETDGDKPLHRAAQAGWADCTKLLVDADRATLETVGRRCWTPLHLAAYAGNKDVLELLLHEGADLMAETKNGNTPVYVATFGSNDEAAVTLLQGMSREQAFTITNDRDESLLRVATRWGCIKVVQHLLTAWGNTDLPKDLLLEKRNERTVGYEAVENGRHEISQLLLEQNASFEGIDADGNSVVHHIAGYGFADILRSLIQRNPEMSLEQLNDKNESPIQLAAKGNHSDVLEFLLRHEAPEVGVPENTKGWKAFHWAAYYNRLDLAILILVGEANIYAQDDSGRIAFEIASMHHPDSIELLELLRPVQVQDPDSTRPVRIDLNRPVPSSGTEEICQNMRAHVVDVYGTSPIEASMFSIFDVIYKYGPDRIMSAMTMARGVSKRRSFRWIHLPANNVRCYLVQSSSMLQKY
ncbi:Ankyrin-2 [Dactylella cylindrospora]|nr:Ankyrin-2 [Dactylella cylindrospora]